MFRRLLSQPLTRGRALRWVALLWAAIYLPALGSLEIKGEEGRRILPATAMLETGNWVLPSVGGEPYLSKPPLINWLIAGAFQLSGTRSEWAARAPSALAVLALGLGLAWRGGAWLGPAGGLLAAIFALTSVGLMEKGRLAEIEALYLACYGLALVDWLASWRAGASPWRLWLPPAVGLGLGLLTKGPLLLLFFYAVVVAALWRAGRLRELAHPAHGVGIALMLGMFAAWAVPYWQQAPAGKVSRAWNAQFTGRLRAEGGFRFKNWVQNVPRGLFNFIPWAGFLPLLWRRTAAGDALAPSAADAAILRGGRAALAACFLLVSLIPGGLPRYTLPLLVPAALLLARVMTAPGRDDGLAPAGGRWRRAPPLRLAGWAAAGMAAITLVYALAVVPRLRRREGLRALAARVNAVGQARPVYALAPGYQPFLFYLRPPPRYVRSVDALPAPAPDGGPEFLLVKEEAWAEAAAQLNTRFLLHETALTLNEKNRGRYRLLRVSAPIPPAGKP